MKISGVGPTDKPAAKRSEKTRRGDGSFASHLHLGSDQKSSVEDGPTTLAGLESILAMQGVDPDASRQSGANRRLIDRGEDLLDRLEEVRRGLLLGYIPKERLAEMAKMVRAKREAGADPQLAAILDEIELRAEVELAKLTRR